MSEIVEVFFIPLGFFFQGIIPLEWKVHYFLTYKIINAFNENK